jgi:hypothetical protein
MISRSTALLTPTLLVWMLFGCTENSTTGPEEEPSVPRGLSYQYEADGALAVSKEITPAGGQTLDCVGPDGTTYSLEVGPGAVSVNTTVTVTPLKYMTITEIDAGGASSAPAVVERPACNVGALFEPAGLTFDSTVVLTVTYAGTTTCDVTDRHRVVYIDPSVEFYDIIPTDVDTDASALACTVTHFSAYVVDEYSRDRLLNLIEVATYHGLVSPSFDIVATLLHYRSEAESNHWSDLVALANEGGHDVLLDLAPLIVQHALDDLTEAPKRDMLRVLEYRQLIPLSDDIETVIVKGMENVINKMVSVGTEWCAGGRKEEGKEMLQSAQTWLDLGPWFDSVPSAKGEIRDEIKTVLNECGPVTIEIEPFSPELFDIAISEEDDNTYVTFEIEVIGAGQDPLVGVSVGLSMTHEGDEHYYKHIGNGTTDEEGVAYIRYFFGPAPGNSAPEGNYSLTASVHHGGEVYTGTGSLVLRRRQVTLNYSYTYQYAKTWADGVSTMNASFVSEGTEGSRGNPDCGPLIQALDQYVEEQGGQRRYSHTVLPSDPPPSGCFFDIRTRTVILDDEIWTPIYVMDYVSVPVRAPQLAWMERVEIEPGYSDTDTILVDVVDYFSLPFPAETEIRFYYPSGMDAYFFQEATIDGNGVAELKMSASVEE